MVEAVINQRDNCDPYAEEKWAKDHGFSITTIADQDFPWYLRPLPTCPPVLYYQGRLPDELGIAVVGTRKASIKGKKQAKHFATQIATSGKWVISGLAMGIDRAAHEGALEARRPTAAVLASPLNRIYPPGHHSLAVRIAQVGCLISEFSSKTRTVPGNFLRRNRIISGMSEKVLVVEAGEKSGALNTADWALDQGKDVLAIPGDIDNPLRKGTNGLIKQGAGLVESAQDVLGDKACNSSASEADEDDRVFYLLKNGVSIDEIVSVTGLPVSIILQRKAMLELDGVLTE